MTPSAASTDRRDSLFAHLIQDPQLPAQAGSDYGGYTQLHPVGAAALAALCLASMLLPRRWLMLPLVLLVCFIPASQRIVLATLDFTFLRLLIAAIWVRILARRELRPMVWNHLDRVMVTWVVVAVVTGYLLGGTLSVLVSRLGYAFDTIALYFFFRQQVRSHADLARIASQFLVCSFAVLAFFVVENRTGRNMFAVFGGVPEITEVRDGRLRCQGPFAHSILAGCFWACLIPYYVLRGCLRQGWLLPAAGSLVAMAIVVLSASSTPVMGLAAGIGAGAMFWMRGLVPWLRWLTIAWLAVLHFFLMKAPVWHLLARVDVVGGSTGDHRYNLIDQFLARWHEWFLIGTPQTGHWGPGLHDITNQFVAEGVAGGIVRLGLFVATVALMFAGVSRSMRLQGAPPAYLMVTWAIGTAQFMHCVNFIGVTYFGEIVVLWQLSLAATASLTLVPGARPIQQLAAMGR